MVWNELLTTDSRLLSLFTIGFVIVMVAYFVRFALRHMAKEARHKLTGG